MTTATNNKPYEVDWDRHNSRNSDEIRADIMTTCYHAEISAKKTARILFAAGYTVKADIVEKFFAGRKRWLEKKAEDRKAAA